MPTASFIWPTPALLDSTLDTSGAGSVYFGLGAYTVGGLTNGGNLLLSSTASAPVTLSVGNNNAYNLSSANLSGNGGITKIGSGLQALSGNNTYTGATIISAGTLQFLGTTAVNSLPSGGSIQMGANTGLSVHADGTGSGGTISVPGSNIQITAAGTEVIDVGSYLISGNTGNIISLGTLINGATNNAFASTFNITGANGDKVSFAGLVLAGTTGNNNSINPTTASVIINGPVTNQITTDAAGNFDTLFIQGSSLGNQINGVISDSPNSTVPGYSATRINANGSGQWIITNEQVYTGSTTVSGGTLQLGNGVQDGALYTSTAGSGNTVALSNNAAFIYDLSSNTSVANYVISGSGRVMVLAGEVTAGTANTYTGATTIASGGSLALGANGSINSTPKITLGNNSALDVSAVSQPWQLRSGQTLGGTGNYLINGTMTNNQGSVIQPGTLAAGSAGTLTTGGLSLGGGTLSYELGSNQDLINVTGNGAEHR